MLDRLLGVMQQSDTPKAMSEISKPDLLSLTLCHFQSNYSISEVNHVWDPTRAMLKELNIDDENFDRKYDEIVFGTIVVARVFAQWHGEFHANMYDKTLKELVKLLNIHSVVTMGDSTFDPGMRGLITGTGKKILDGELPFKADYLARHESFAKNIPLLQRLNVYRPDIVDSEQQLTAREKALIALVTSQKEQIVALKQELKVATDTIEVMKPKAEWHDEEQHRRQLEEAVKRNEKKHIFGHFRRK